MIYQQLVIIGSWVGKKSLPFDFNFMSKNDHMINLIILCYIAASELVLEPLLALHRKFLLWKLHFLVSQLINNLRHKIPIGKFSSIFLEDLCFDVTSFVQLFRQFLANFF